MMNQNKKIIITTINNLPGKAYEIIDLIHLTLKEGIILKKFDEVKTMLIEKANLLEDDNGPIEIDAIIDLKIILPKKETMGLITGVLVKFID